jgi:hypothetical protein
MDPEHELAIKVSEYIECLWDGRAPAISIEGGAQFTLTALLPPDLGSLQADKAPGTFRDSVRAGDTGAIAGSIALFLYPASLRKPELRRASKTAGLWLSEKRPGNEHEFADRYVPPREMSEEVYLDPARRYEPADPFNESVVLAEVTAKSSQLIAEDLVRLHKIFGDQPIFQHLDVEKTDRKSRPMISIASIQYNLASKFFERPEWMRLVADAVGYLPSFTARIAANVIAAAPISQSKRVQQIVATGMYSIGRKYFINHAAAPIDLRVSWQMEHGEDFSPYELVSAVVRAIDPEAIGQGPEAASPGLSRSDRGLLFDVGMCLIENKRWCVLIADAYHVPVPFGVLLEEELNEIDVSRPERRPEIEPPPLIKAKALKNPYARALVGRLVGLCVSGGGIRSATFALGVLQRLAELGLLSRLDYLSTVSGGGYIGGWLVAWIQRANLRIVEKNIQSMRSPSSEQTRPIRFLREYSQYLAPQSGLFTADLWTMIAIFIRNLILNQAIILLVLGALIVLPMLMIGPIALSRTNPDFALVCLITGTASILWSCWNIRRASIARGTYGHWRQSEVLARIVAPVLVSCVVFTVGLWGHEFRTQGRLREAVINHFYSLSAGLVFCGLSIAHFTKNWRFIHGRKERRAPRALFHLSLLVLTSLCGMLFFAIPKKCLDLWSTNTFRGDWEVLVFGPSLMLLAFSLTDIFYIGIFGRELHDAKREWWARLGAWLGLASGAWLLLAAISVYGPEWLYRLSTSMKITLTSAWAFISAAGTWFAGGPGTGSPHTKTLADRAREAVAAIAPYVFIGGLLCFVSLGVQILCVYADDAWPYTAPPWEAVRIGSLIVAFVGFSAASLRPRHGVFRIVRNSITIVLFALAALPWIYPGWHFLELMLEHRRNPYRHIFGHYWATMNLHPGVPLLIFVLLAAAGILLSVRVDVNEFSMHHFYRNRLVRAYLGASRERKIRRPSPFTGFDERDDISLSLLRSGKGYFGPLPVLNAAVNVTRGEDLATQERKAESFTFTPFRSGFDFFKPHLNPAPAATGQYGYQLSSWKAFGDEIGVRLGTAMAISGAAVNPNSGYHSKPAIAFLLSLFNVRLGWWLRNPADQFSPEDPSPRFGLLYLLRELGGYTNVRSPYLNLSDGGHFDNMGLYEMIRRRCRFIVLSDAEQDEEFAYEGLGSAIRKCRTDFGVDIDLDPRKIKPVEGVQNVHCAVGDITYQDGTPGYLLYIKTSLTGDEPADVLEYRNRFSEFPHQPTTDQFFTESQFESYRCLGHHVAEKVFERAVPIPDGPDWQKTLFQRLSQTWSATADESDY